jgi:hypothetical protein
VADRWRFSIFHLPFTMQAVRLQRPADGLPGGPGYSRALMFKDKLRPIGQWYHVAQFVWHASRRER